MRALLTAAMLALLAGLAAPAHAERIKDIASVAGVRANQLVGYGLVVGLDGIDVTVATIGNASSLRGGALIMTPLRGADGQIYAMAQGNVVVSGFGINGKDGSRISLNVPSSGRIPNGASVEREVPVHFAADPHLVLNLHTPDFTTAAHVSGAIV